ncbi:MAG: ester cyclase [Gammaproteobacteria bacterium]|nr:ester cyclase [Gammaproteobacteria bacterium]
MSTDLQTAKQLVLDFHEALERGRDNPQQVLEQHVSEDYHWRGMHPFYEQTSAQSVASVFWEPLFHSFTALQRRPDIFLAGHNDVDQGATQWVCSMGHFMGLFDRPWLGIPATGRITFLRYAEFNQVDNGKITQTALFCDVISVMEQAGHYPLPPQTGAAFVHPGPRTHDGLLFTEHDPTEASKTVQLVNRMVADLGQLNSLDDHRCPPELLARTWHEDMIWYGPAGIGATYTIERYQKQHQYPFRLHLKDKTFNGHVARFAEGQYACFFGWANLTNTPSGGFLGLPGNNFRCDMRVVDVYRRDGDKLAENWVFIDLLHYLSMQGLDILERLRTDLL